MKLIDLVPSSIRDDPQVEAACEAIDIELDSILEEIPQLNFWGGSAEKPNLEKIVPPLLDVLMWEFHVDIHQMLIAMEGDIGLTNELKRKLLNESILWHQKKGTPWIIEHALAVLFENIDLIEWYEYGGRPYYFKVVASSALNDPHLYNKVLATIYELKNVRSWLEEFIIARPSMHYLWEAEVTVRRVYTTIWYMTRPTVPDPLMVYAGLAIYLQTTIMIDAPEED